MPSRPTQDMSTTNTQLSQRLTTVETTLETQGHALAHLTSEQTKQGESIARMESNVGSLTGATNSILSKLETMGSSVSGTQATKGMIDGKTVLAVIASLIALVSVGFTMLSVFKSDLKEDMNHNAQKDALRMEALAKEIDDNTYERKEVVSTVQQFKDEYWNPHISSQAHLEEQVKELMLHSHELFDHKEDMVKLRGYLESELETIKRRLGEADTADIKTGDRVLQQAAEQAALEAKVKQLAEKIQRIDQFGSIKWLNKGAPIVE